ncbi:hypothetical protein FXB39_00685 [Nocardioides sp. BGMRC 2183]|nr:hypothetical protein FXB39_00685 [Nocardioides sp. BGMRC 2183]
MQFDVDAVLFDIDGTLVDSTPAVERTWATWVSRHNVDVAEVLGVCHGRRTQDTVELFVSTDEQPGAVAELGELELADLADVVALRGTRALLARLPADRWAAVTSGSQRLMRARLAAAGLPTPDVFLASPRVDVLRAEDPNRPSGRCVPTGAPG